ncbi:ComEA family DNA-binding protein [Virgibacillus siamensis]|uniref:ComEA family DNA-binding protein n=1 Tax=Virgibacillus siamensis TaxID=480071 RepID=UPI001FE480A2|nr:ComEA family DNA-binding protein [Virgibacillus siamensis]
MVPDFLKKNFVFILTAIGIGLFFFIQHGKVEENNLPRNEVSIDKSSDSEAVQEETASTAVVDVKGAVKKPGVYEVRIDSRVNDVISLAGGFTKGADQSVVNLAQKVQDEMIIVVPKTGAQNTAAVQTVTGNTDKIRINFASEEEMETLNGIGPSKAAAIIQYRDEFGPFKTVEDLLEVPGIGEKTLENLRESIQIP